MELLKDFLYEAIFIPEGVNPPVREVIEQPELKLYYEDFGTGGADHCIVADDDGRVIGAVWTGRANQIWKRWKYAVRLNEELSRKISTAICRFAGEQGCDVLVFEYLDMQGKILGSRKQKLHLWRKRDVQKRCEHMAHRMGMRFARVNARGTSALAYDGSGKVVRDRDNYSMCTFRSGKRYHCDLSASYNIGARYWIREIFKSLPETTGSLLEAEVPAVKRRSRCVYADLILLNRSMREKNIA